MLKRSLLALSVAALVMAGCKKKEDAVETPAATAQSTTETASTPAATPAVATSPVADASATQAFDINSVPVSDKPLGEWPLVTLPAGYHYDNKDELASQSKDLARVPVWTGAELLWVEGRTFSDKIRADEGKTYSKFEVRKALQQTIEAMGGKRISERSFGEDIYKAKEKELEDFRQEFDDIRDAYWYDADADTYVIRRADKVIWIVSQGSNNRAALMVVEGPLPPPAVK